MTVPPGNAGLSTPQPAQPLDCRQALYDLRAARDRDLGARQRADLRGGDGIARDLHVLGHSDCQALQRGHAGHLAQRQHGGARHQKAGEQSRFNCSRRTPPWMWRGRLFGATSTTSKRMSRLTSSGWLREPGLRRRDDAALLPHDHGFRRIVEPLARLHLDEHQRAAPARHDVDLADRAAPAPRHDAVALGDQVGGGAALGREAEAECDLPLRRAARSDSGVRRAIMVLRKLERAAVDRAARLSGRGRDFGHRVLHARCARARRAAARRSRPRSARSARPAARSRSRSRRASRRPPHSRAPASRACRAALPRAAWSARAPIAAVARAQGPPPDRRASRRCAARSRTAPGLPGCAISSAIRARRAPALAGRKPSKKNRSVGSPATVSAVSTAEAPGAAMTGMAGRHGVAHQPVARIGDQRRAGIGDQRDGAPGGEPFEDFRPRRLGVVVVIGDQRRRQAVMVEQLAGDAGVLAGDEIGGGQNFERRAASCRAGSRSASPPDRGRRASCGASIAWPATV